MSLTDLTEALHTQGYTRFQVFSIEEKVTVVFRDPEDGRKFAGSLLCCGVPRSFHNNKVDANVSFQLGHLSRALELLRWTE